MSSKMEELGTPTDRRLAARLRALREEKGWSLQQLAEASGVSRSMISLVERGASSPSANVLDRLAGSFGLSLAALFAGEVQAAASPLSRLAEQHVWRDPVSRYLRRSLSPAGFTSPLLLVEVRLPPRARVLFDNPPRPSPPASAGLVAGRRIGDPVGRR